MSIEITDWEAAASALEPNPAIAPNAAAIRQHIEFAFRPAYEAAYEDALVEIAYEAAPESGPNGARLFDVDHIDDAVAFAVAVNQTGRNVYIGAGLRAPDTKRTGRCEAPDFYVAGAVAIDIDRDYDATRKALAEICTDSLTVTTGTIPEIRSQHWVRLQTPADDPAEFTEAWQRLIFAVGSDANAKDGSSRVMRLGGTVSYPAKKKVDRGYRVELTRVTENPAAAPVSIDRLLALEVDETKLMASSSRGDRAAGPAGEIVEDGFGKVIDGREQKFTSIVFRESSTFQQSNGVDPTFDDLWPAAFKRFCFDCDVSDGVWTRNDGEPLKRRVHNTLKRLKAGKLGKYGIASIETGKGADEAAEYERRREAEQHAKVATAAAEQGSAGDTSAPATKAPRRAQNYASLVVTMRSSPVWQGVVAYDRFSGEVLLQKPVPRRDGRVQNDFTPRAWSDADLREAWLWFQLGNYPKVGAEMVQQAVTMFAEDHGFDSLADYFGGLVWDGVPRINSWLVDFCGAAEHDQPREYLTAVGRRWLISGVARALQPGCKVDCTLLLVGAQGAKKSTTGRVLGSPWFSDSLPDIGTKDAVDHLRGKFLLEIGEMSAMTRADVNSVKSFLVRQEDIFRPAYGRNQIRWKRRCVFLATTNVDNGVLRDETGGRRFWPVEVGACEAEGLAKVRDQLWAEAKVAYQAGEQWWLTADEEALAQEQQAAHTVIDERLADVMARFGSYEKVTTRQIAEHLNLGYEKRDQMEIASMLKPSGWVSKRINGVRVFFPRKSLALQAEF